MTKRLLTLICACLLCAGCNLIYKQNIQQGNALEQEDLDQLELGMSKNQVAFLLGTPAIQDPFHQDRWDYVSSFARRGNNPVVRKVTLRFENDALTSMTGVGEGEGEGEETITESGPQTIGMAGETGVPSDLAADDEDLTAAPDANENWSIQAGAFDNRAAANGRLFELSEAGYDAEINTQVVGSREYFIVRLAGDYDRREDALAVMADFEEKTGIRPFLVTPGN